MSGTAVQRRNALLRSGYLHEGSLDELIGICRSRKGG
jgi:hypothetical protein